MIELRRWKKALSCDRTPIHVKQGQRLREDPIRGPRVMTGEPETMHFDVGSEIRRGGDARVESRMSTIAFDGTAQTGDVLPGPADLLCATLSACILENVERYPDVVPSVHKSATVCVIAEREEPPPHIPRKRYELVIVGDETKARVELLHRNIQKYGTITNTSSKACEVRRTIRAAPTGTAGS
jgi:hypothetical protein